MSIRPRIGHALVKLGARSAARRFNAACADVERAQRELCTAATQRSAVTAYGADHGLPTIAGVADFRARVPVVGWDDISPYIERIAAGEQNVLTPDPVTVMEPTSGSAGPVKLIPYTAGLRQQFSDGVMAWIADLYSTWPQIARGTAYWAASPPEARTTTTSGGLPIGVEDDTDYLPPIIGSFVGATMAAPSQVEPGTTVERSRHETLVHLLARDDLTMISVWSPTFLTLLLQQLDATADAVLAEVQQRARQLHIGRARMQHLTKVLARGVPDDVTAIWPNLALVSCWADGPSARFVPAITRRCGTAMVQGKGLLSTEGVTSIPINATADPVLAATSHLIEFLPVDDPAASPLWAHEVTVGERYEVVLTTAGGMMRYRTSDIVEITGHHRTAPTMRFVGRVGDASDLVGEKLTGDWVAQCIARALLQTGLQTDMSMLVPRHATEQAGYVLYLGTNTMNSAQLDAVGAAADEALAQAHHYGLARRLGQLEPVTARALPAGAQTVEAELMRRGQRSGDTKPPALTTDTTWHDILATKEHTT